MHAVHAMHAMHRSMCSLPGWVQSMHQGLQGLVNTGLGPFKPEDASDMALRAEQGIQNSKTADRVQKAAEGRQQAQQEAVVQYARDLAMDAQGHVSGEMVQKQTQMMSVCFEGLCHEVGLSTTTVHAYAVSQAAPERLMLARSCAAAESWHDGFP